MTTNKKTFKKYAELGKKLIDLHLLKNLPDDTKIRFSLAGIENNFVIAKIEQSGEKLFLNVVGGKTITISGVTDDIYNFEIGSYRPIEKWLKYRIKDSVSLCISDLNHLKNMIVSIKETINTMQEIENHGETYLQ
jgi:predicted helicase